MLLVPAAAVVVIGVAFGLAGSGVLTGVRPSGTPQGTPVVIPSDQPSAPPSTESGWTQRQPFMEPSARINDMMVAADRMVAVGADESGPAAWTSTDGIEWQRSQVGDSSLPSRFPRDREIVAAAAHGDRLLALGVLIADTNGQAWTGLWESLDGGVTWTAAPSFVRGMATGITSTASGFVIVGGNAANSRASGAWTSNDGSQWTEVKGQAALDQGTISFIASSGTGLVVGVGSRVQQDPFRVMPMTWSSPNGSTWSANAMDPKIDGRFNSIVATGDGWVAGGEIVSLEATGGAIWRSTNGHDWQLVAVQPETLTFVDLATLGNATIAIGLPRSPDQSGSYSESRHAWLVTPSRTLTPVPQLQGASKVVAFRGRFVAIAGCSAPDDGCRDAAVITGQPSLAELPSPSPAPVITATPRSVNHWSSSTIADGDSVAVQRVAEVEDELMAVGRDGWGGAIWHSRDGREWERIADVPAVAADKAVQLTNVAYSSIGYVATGVWGPRSSEAGGMVVWTSADGAHWRDATDWSRGASVLDIIPTDEGFLAVGGQLGQTYGNGAAAWSSSDGMNWTPANVGNSENATMLDVIAVPDGFVAVGLQRNSTGFRPAVWRSSDGLKWEQMASPGGTSEGAMSALAASGAVLVAIGGSATDAEAAGMVWRSADSGVTWEPIYRATCCHTLTGIARTAAGFIVSGTATDGAGTVALRSTDGAAWELAGPIASTSVHGLLQTEGLGTIAWSGSRGETNSVYSILFAPPSATQSVAR
jgi:hypothetical protein